MPVLLLATTSKLIHERENVLLCCVTVFHFGSWRVFIYLPLWFYKKILPFLCILFYLSIISFSLSYLALFTLTLVLAMFLSRFPHLSSPPDFYLFPRLFFHLKYHSIHKPLGYQPRLYCHFNYFLYWSDAWRFENKNPASAFNWTRVSEWSQGRLTSVWQSKKFFASHSLAIYSMLKTEWKTLVYYAQGEQEKNMYWLMLLLLLRKNG